MPTNFDLAPPAVTVDGLVAVPIDIQTIDAHLHFDGATQAATAEATLTFVVGPTPGNPVFDLRQTITAAWLDGASLAPSDLAPHDFGGGTGAALRIVVATLAAGSTHTLRVQYALGPPQASAAGSYQPALVWSSGPRLAFNFGFTDLGPGRYLESWIPANLVFDQFELLVEITLANVAVSHTVLTNAAVTSLGANHWRLAFPDRFTALSPLLELRATDTLASATGTVTLPVSGDAVTVEAWSLRTSGVDLAAEVDHIEAWLAANELEVGEYLHGNRFVAFLHVGGMEYEGATTASPGSLRHETFHSWWARGVKPAAQCHGWFDEAWTVYNDGGATGTVPFDFTDPAVTLCNRNPWSRVTPSASYTQGERFFEGLAAMSSAPALRGLLRDFYRHHTARPVTTEALEAFVVARLGDADAVDAFHRFVYGFGDPARPPELWLRDEVGHGGEELWSGRFWDSPDLWIRNADDGGTTHQAPEHGQDNWFYARVRNRGSASVRHFVATFNVKQFAGTEFSYPADFLPATAAAVGFDLGPGADMVVRAPWPAALIPPPGTHACWLASVLARGAHPAAGSHVWERKALGQKNLTVVDLRPDAWFVLPFVLNRFRAPRAKRSVVFDLVRPPGAEKLEASIVTGLRRSANELRLPALDGSMPLGDAPSIEIGSGLIGRVRVPVARFGPMLAGLRIHVPSDATPGDRLRLDLVQRSGDAKRIVGGLAVEVRVSKQ